MSEISFDNIPPEPEEELPLDEGELNERLRQVYANAKASGEFDEEN